MAAPEDAARASSAPGPHATGWNRRRIAVADRIERKALELFAEHGVENVTIEQIASAAGFSERNFFRYFRSREDVLAAYPARALARTVETIRNRPPDEPSIRAFAMAMYEIARSESAVDFNPLYGQIMRRSPAAASAAVGRLHPNITEAFGGVIAERLRARGQDDSDAHLLGASVAGVCTMVYRTWVKSGCQGSLPERLYDAYCKLADIFEARDAR